MNASKPAASTSRLRWEVLEASANKGGNSQEDNFLPKMHLPTTIRRNSRRFKMPTWEKGEKQMLAFFDGEADLMSDFI